MNISEAPIDLTGNVKFPTSISADLNNELVNRLFVGGESNLCNDTIAINVTYCQSIIGVACSPIDRPAKLLFDYDESECSATIDIIAN